MSVTKDPGQTLLRCLRAAYRQADHERRDYVVVANPRRDGIGEGDCVPYYVPFDTATSEELNSKGAVVVTWRHPEESKTQDVIAKVMGCLHRAGKCPEDPTPALRDALKLLAQEIERRVG